MCLRVFIVLCFLISHVSYADSWLDKVKSGYQQVKERVISQPNEESQPLKALPTDKPEDWHYSYMQAPVFDAKIAVLQAGQQHKESVLLVHGLGELGMQDWYSVIPYLAKSYHVIAIDLPGFGYSEKPIGRYSPANYAKVLDAVSKKYRKESLTVVGHSMGGAVSLRFAAIAPDAIDKLVLVDVAGILEKTAFIKHTGKLPIDESSIPSSLRNIIAQLNDVGGAIVEMTSINSISRLVERSDLTWELVKHYPNVNAAISLIEEDFGETLQLINVDTRIIWGELDGVAPLRTGKVLSAKISAAELSVIQGAGHVPMKSHPQSFQRLLSLAMAPRTIQTQTSNYSHLLERQNITCHNENNRVYSGVYNEIKLNNCSNVELINVNANKLSVIDSLVNAENLTIVSSGSALSAIESVLNITNGEISTTLPLELSGSRLDIAGVNIIASKNSINVSAASKLIFSVSSIHDEFYQGNVHGAFKLHDQNIAQVLNKKNHKNVH